MLFVHPPHRVVWLAPLVPLVAIAAALGLASPVTAQNPLGAEYVIGPEDVLAVTVFNQEKLTGKYQVGADGTINFPDLGRLKAGGFTVQTLETDLRDRLAKNLYRNPQVTVSVDQYRSQRVYVMGQVRQPQPLEFKGSMDLVEALARAGSVSERAGVEVLILRSPNGGPPDQASLARASALADSKDPAKGPKDPNVTRVNLEALQAGDFSQNVPLRSGDIVSVLPAKTVFVQGQIARAGEYPIRTGMTVQQVLVLAGGITDRGTDRRIQIIRQVDGKKMTIDASTEDMVLSGDIINVRQRFF